MFNLLDVLPPLFASDPQTAVAAATHPAHRGSDGMTGLVADCHEEGTISPTKVAIGLPQMSRRLGGARGVALCAWDEAEDRGGVWMS